MQLKELKNRISLNKYLIKRDKPQMTGSKIGHNGWPGRGHEVGVVWAVLWAGNIFPVSLRIVIRCLMILVLSPDLIYNPIVSQ